ncbi:MAG: sugar transferase [Myxococcota bacterium]|nr:sugar transferase [Myxococcales bacterium]
MLKERGRQLHLAFMVIDAALTVGLFAWVARQMIRRPETVTEVGLVTLLALAAISGLAWPLILGRFGIYESQRRDALSQTFARLLAGNGLGALLLSGLAALLDAPLAPAFPLVFATTTFFAQATLRAGLYGVLHVARRTGHNTRTVVVIGAGPRASRALATIDQHPEWGLRVLGFVDDGEPGFAPHVPVELIHKMVELPGLLRDSSVDEVLVACPRSMLDSLVPVVRECAQIGVPVTLLTDLFGDELPPPRVGRFDSLGTVTFAPVHHNEMELAVKRGVDIAGATLGLLLAAPVVGLAALAIKLDDGGPVLFRQWRCGLNGRQFPMLKLRTMVPDADRMKADLLHLNELDGPVFKIKDDPRVTRVGRVLRKWSIDELPQFWNVLIGEMSLVGPRPPTPDEVVLYEGGDRRRLSMRPGLTCLWAVAGRNQIRFDEWMRLDLEYIDTWDLGQDFRILARTIPAILSGRGAS